MRVAWAIRSCASQSASGESAISASLTGWEPPRLALLLFGKLVGRLVRPRPLDASSLWSEAGVARVRIRRTYCALHLSLCRCTGGAPFGPSPGHYAPIIAKVHGSLVAAITHIPVQLLRQRCPILRISVPTAPGRRLQVAEA